MKTATEVCFLFLFYRYACAEEFKEIHVFARGQLNHLHKLLRVCDRRISIQQQKKTTSGNFVPNKSFHLKYMLGLPL